MFTPYRYQKESVKATSDYFRHEQTGRGLIALPTGSGKSIVIFMIVNAIHKAQKRVLVLVDSTELVRQNHAKVIQLGDEIDTGICMGTDRQYDVENDVIFGCRKTYMSYTESSKPNDYIIVDEAHMFGRNPESVYWKIYHAEKKKNPNLRLIGLTATPFDKKGYLTEGENPPFDKIIYEKTYDELVELGCLSQLITPKQSDLLELDISNTVLDINDEEITEKLPRIIDKVIILAGERKKCLFFTNSIQYCEIVNDVFLDKGIPSAIIHSKAKGKKEILKTFKETNDYRLLGSVGMLGKGVDIPDVDCIIFLSPIGSLNDFRQKLGRGTRISPEKKDCLIIDFGGNINRHGEMDNDYAIKKLLKLENKEEKEEEEEEKQLSRAKSIAKSRAIGKGLIDRLGFGVTGKEELTINSTGVHFIEYTTYGGSTAIIANFMDGNTRLFNVFFNVLHPNQKAAFYSKKNLRKFFPCSGNLIGQENLQEYLSTLNQRYTFHNNEVTIYRNNGYINIKQVKPL